MILLYLGWIIISIGIFFIFSSILGIFRMKNVYTKIHAASICDSFGIPLCLIGFAMIQTNMMSVIKILIILVFFIVLAPLTSHSLISAAWIADKKRQEK